MSDDAMLNEFNEKSEKKENVADEHPRFESLPHDWKISEIASIAEVVGGSTPSTSNKKYWDGGIPWATPTDITALSGNTISETEDTITKKGLESASTHLLPPKSVLMTSRATIGECAVNTIKMATNQGFKNLVPSDEIEHWYLYYRMLDTAGFLNSLGSGSTFDEISKTDVQSVDIPIPPLSEQRKIATVLHTVDQAIQKTEDIIHRLQKTLTGTRQELMRIGTRGYQMSNSDSRFGEIPENWKIEVLDSIADVTGGSTPSTDEPTYWDGEIPWATPTDLTGLDEITISTTESYITEEGLNSTSTNLLPPQSVLMTSRATIGECAVNIVEMATNQGFQTLVPHDGIDAWYLYYRMEEEANYLNSLGSGSTFSEVSNTTVQSVKIPIPPVDEQKEIANMLKSIDETIIKQKEYKSQLQRFRQGLMQDLLSGEVRTTDTDIDIPQEIAQHG